MSTDTHRHVGSRGAEGAAPAQEPCPPVSAGEAWRVVLALPGWDASALGAAGRRMSELCAARTELAVSEPRRVVASEHGSNDVVITLAARDGGAVCAWLELEASLARGVVDLALGGTADTAELGHLEALDATRTGVLLYMAACVLRSVPQDALRIVGVQPASDGLLPERLACAARVTLQGRVYGAQLSVDVTALPAPTPWPTERLREASLPEWARDASCQLTLELGRGALDAATLSSLEPGDVLIPDIVTAEPGPWESATLRCDAFAQPLASVTLDASGVLMLAEARGAASLALAPSAPALCQFTVEAARMSVRIADVQRWLVEGRLPFTLDALAPLTLWQGRHALARGHLVRDRSDVGLCIESVRGYEPDTHPY